LARGESVRVVRVLCALCVLSGLCVGFCREIGPNSPPKLEPVSPNDATRTRVTVPTSGRT